MKRRALPLLAAVVLLSLAVLASQKKGGDLLLLTWAAKARTEPAPVAVLVEMGLRDARPHDWSGRATVTGARVVHREGYRFRPADKLDGADGWKASSHFGLRVPPRAPAIRLMEPLATVGVVLHLADIRDGAILTIRINDGDRKETVALDDVLAGKPHPLWDGKALVRRVSAASPVATGKTEDDHPAAALGPDGTLWVAYVSYTVRDESRRIEQKAYTEQPADFKSLSTPEFADQLFVTYLRGGKWGPATPVTGAKEDLVRCAVAVEGGGRAWVVYSANGQGNYDLYARSVELPDAAARTDAAPRLGREQRLTKNPGPDLGPVACTDRQGHVHVAWQSWDESGLARIGWMSCRDGKWGPGRVLADQNKGENRWHPAIAAGPTGEVAFAYDVYRDGDYDVEVAVLDRDRKQGTIVPIATSAKFEARPSLAYDARGRLWIAYEEGPERWGKDYGALVANQGNPLYNARSVRVVCLDGDQLHRPTAGLPTSAMKPPTIPFDIGVANKYEKSPRSAYPRIGLDGKGRLWLTYRQKFGTRYTTHPGSYWLTFARRLDGDRWTEPMEIHHSDGLLDHRPALLPERHGGLWVIHNTDGRYTTPEQIDNQIYAGVVALPGEPQEPKLEAHAAGRKDPKRGREERAAVERMRRYRIEAGGKTYQLLRGEFHRHTEISWDGGPDGSLEDMFRYAIDAAAMDWIGNGDHDNGAGREYSWWLVQKFTDAYTVPRSFTPLFCYERSVAYPHGHRNCLFVQRGVRTLPRLAQADPQKRVAGIHADDTKMLYRYLKEHRGLCAVHTSATGMGTDWRDNDPAVEPLVEIYQGDRMSYEKEDAPRAGYDPKSGKAPANIAGWYPKGFINNALDKGYRLGFESSSDHWSTHISYCVALAERHGRAGIHDALRRRHAYGATDDIIVNVRSGPHLMGDEFRTGQAPKLEITVLGTARLARIDIVKDSEAVESIKPGKASYEGTWTDPKPAAGVHYYYVRVVQEDRELAWTSPMWIDYRK